VRHHEGPISAAHALVSGTSLSAMYDVQYVTHFSLSLSLCKFVHTVPGHGHKSRLRLQHYAAGKWEHIAWVLGNYTLLRKDFSRVFASSEIW
jgi:hypothetical protein